MEMEWAHRSGKLPGKEESRRPILGTFLRFKDKVAVLDRLRNLRKATIIV